MTDGTHEPPASVVARVAEVLAGHGVTDFAYTGGVAVGVWASPRQTHDLDVCGVLPADEVFGSQGRLLALRDGIRSGAGELPDMVRFRVGDWDVDLFVSKSDYDANCLDRAVAASLDGVEIKVVAAEDLLIHKLIKLRTDRRRVLQDIADLRAVLDAQADGINWDYLRLWLPADELKLLATVASADDEALLQRLLGGD